jgi:hypothetical protein
MNRDLGPLITKTALQAHDLSILVLTPHPGADIGIQEICPSLVTLLPVSARYAPRYLCPVSCSVLLNKQPVTSNKKNSAICSLLNERIKRDCHSNLPLVSLSLPTYLRAASSSDDQ